MWWILREKAAHRADKLARIKAEGGKGLLVSPKAAKVSAGANPAAAGAVGTTAAAVTASITSGSGYTYLNIVQQPQITDSWCGEATASEMAFTVPGPSNADQSTIGHYWGSGAHNGTSTTQMQNGLNNFVGVPDYGFNFYGFVSWLNNSNPTSSQRTAFLDNLKTDVNLSSPIAGDAWEVAGSKNHLTGHPVGTTIYHWFEIGGWNTNTSQIYYADSVFGSKYVSWSASVKQPRYWFNLSMAETIMGGRGYVW